ncbi:MAG: type I restriction endonuclease, partial [Planctomycetota bacterium]
MSLAEKLETLSERFPGQLPHVKTEEATKNAFVMPVINALGFNVFDPSEVVPEFVADVGVKKGEKVDYAIYVGGKPLILIECKTAGSKLSLKHASQLLRYYGVTEAKIAVLTNGIDWEFFTDIDTPNRMDERPFMTVSFGRLDSDAIEQLG